MSGEPVPPPWRPRSVIVVGPTWPRRWGIRARSHLRLVLIAAAAYLGLECTLACAPLLPPRFIPTGPAVPIPIFGRPVLRYPYRPEPIGVDLAWISLAGVIAYVALYRRAYLSSPDGLQRALKVSAMAVALPGVIAVLALGEAVSSVERLSHAMALNGLVFAGQFARFLLPDLQLLRLGGSYSLPPCLIVLVLLMLPGFFTGALFARGSPEVRVEPVAGVAATTALLEVWASKHANPILLVRPLDGALPWALAVAAQVFAALLGGLVGRGIYAAVARRGLDRESPEVAP